MQHQTPDIKQWLWRQALQAISGGQVTEQDIAWCLRVNSFGDYDDDSNIAKEGKDTHWDVNC